MNATVCWYDLVTSALSFAVQRIKHCPLGKTSGTLVFYDQHLKTLAKVCRAEAWSFVCREQSSKFYKRSIITFDHQTTSLGRLRPVSSYLTGLSLPRLVVWWSNGMIDLLYNFELSSRHTKVQSSALQTFANVLNVDLIKNEKQNVICI